MREILFRGKTRGGVWYHGFVKGKSLPNKEGNKMEFTPCIIEQTHADIEVIPETVGQYTGLTDKNGNQIFEGDIVEYASDEEIGQIAYHESEAMFVVEFDTWLTDFDHMYGKDLEVIGNIHDNPELLKGGEG